MNKPSKKYPEPVDEIKAVKEPLAPAYRTGAGVMFPAHTTKSQNQMTSFEKIDLIRHGISKADFERFKQRSGLDYDQMAATLSVARATLINKKGAEKFSQSLSEKIVSLADIYSYGYEVFEDVDRFNAWIFKPNRALGGLAPYNLLDNQYGREEVRDLIGRIDYGVYS